MVGIGLDAVDLDRFRRALARTPRLAERVFTAGERADAGASADPAPRLAARFAAKEACMKALGVGLGAFSLREVEVVRDRASGRPTLRLHGTAAALAATRGVRDWRVSLTHTRLVAQAVVVAL
jgi:holo-[acyl-carrier protein] synthase